MVSCSRLITLEVIASDTHGLIGVGTFSRSISRTVEYAFNDFCIAEMAQSLHKTADAEKYLKRSKNWKNMWNPNQNSYIFVNNSDGSTGYVDSGFYGFLQPRYLNGTFGYQDAMMCSPMYRFTDCYLVPTGHEVRFLSYIPFTCSFHHSFTNSFAYDRPTRAAAGSTLSLLPMT